jgi:hypothetical protein
MQADAFVHDIEILLTVVVIYALSEIVALYLVNWAEQLVDKGHARGVR